MSDFNIPNPQSVDLTTASQRDVACYYQISGNEYDGELGARISAIFVILVVSSAVTFFPVLATRVPRLRIPIYVYLFARYFGAGVILATGFIHLLDPAYSEIGPDTCIGLTDGWSEYSWVPAITLFSITVVFLMDFGAERYVEKKYGFYHGDLNVEGLVTGENHGHGHAHSHDHGHDNHQYLHSSDQGDLAGAPMTSPLRHSVSYLEPRRLDPLSRKGSLGAKKLDDSKSVTEVDEKQMLEDTDRSFHSQIAAFLILEFGVIFHSVIIGLNLGTSSNDDFAQLYPVLVFHQSFEGLGVGARLSAIPFPKRWSWLPWIFCTAYGLTTPISIAIGLGVRNTYSGDNYTPLIVSGILDSISAGILIYTGLVELIARDFLFNPERTRDDKRLTFMIVSLLLGAALMALLGKWA